LILFFEWTKRMLYLFPNFIFKCDVVTFVVSNTTEVGSAGEQPAKGYI